MQNSFKITNGPITYKVVQIGEDEYKLIDDENRELSRIDSSNNHNLTEVWNSYHIDKFMRAHNMWICDQN